MSPSNKLVVVFPIKRTDHSTFFDKGKGPSIGAFVADSDDESSQAFAKMSRTERDKLTHRLFKYYP